MGKTTGIDPDELCEYKVKMTTNQPRTWKVDPERRTITFKKGEA